MNLRAADPSTAAFIDAMREAFGAAEITEQIKAGMAGVPGRFHYKGPAGEVGTPAIPGRVEISGDDMVLESINPLAKDGRR